MKLEKYISELLFEHDCVILPGFGGLVCNRVPASIHPNTHRFHPPFKKISFNRSLRNNDGLLANHISMAEQVSYSEANRIIDQCIAHFNTILARDTYFKLENIGSFSQGSEGTIAFEQDATVNYLPDSFGLTAFYSPAIVREPLERKIEKKLKDKVIVPPKEEKKEIPAQRRRPVLKYMAAAASVLILTALFFVSVNTGLINNTGFANLNPFGETPLALYHPDPSAFPDPDNDVTKDNVRDLIASASRRPDTLHYLNIMINGNIPIVVSLKDDKTSVAKVKASPKTKRGNFHIIGGAFAVAENAEKFVAKLKNLGYDAHIIDKKLHMVSYGSFSTREEALEAMEKIRSVQGDVWLMKM